MNLYKRESLLPLLNPATITALKNIYGLSLRHIAARLNCRPQNAHYLLKNDCLKDWHKEKILDLFFDHGLEAAELILIHTMTAKRGQNHAIDQ